MLTCKTLASGSTGNAVYFQVDDRHFLIDAGLSMKKLDGYLRALDTCLRDLDGIFITHEHSDHTKALGMIAKHTQVPIFCTEPTAREIYLGLSGKATAAEAEAFRQNARILTPNQYYHAGRLTLIPYTIPHDSAQCVGYLLQDDNGEKLLGYGADMGHVTTQVVEHLTGCKQIILESNHDPDMLENSAYPAFLKERIRSDYGHLSNGDCAQFAAYLVQNHTRHITLFHLSQENNRPDIALECTRSFLENLGAKENEDFTLNVAVTQGITEVCQ